MDFTILTTAEIGNNLVDILELVARMMPVEEGELLDELRERFPISMEKLGVRFRQAAYRELLFHLW